MVVADLCPFRDSQVFVDDRPPDFYVTTGFHVVKQNRVFNQAETVDLAARSDDGAGERCCHW